MRIHDRDGTVECHGHIEIVLEDVEVVKAVRVGVCSVVVNGSFERELLGGKINVWKKGIEKVK